MFCGIFSEFITICVKGTLENEKYAKLTQKTVENKIIFYCDGSKFLDAIVYFTQHRYGSIHRCSSIQINYEIIKSSRYL